MPTDRNSRDDTRAAPTTAAYADETCADARTVRLVPGGPMLVEGPVRIVGEDGTEVISDRFVVAVCRCHRSGIYPLCDTSHRRSVRTPRR